MISAVSGGTLPATYYALRGEKTFEEFEAKVLSRNLEIELAKRIVLNPVNWFRLPSGTFGKSDIFAELYDETVFDHATFADLKRANGPSSSSMAPTSPPARASATRRTTSTRSAAISRR